MKMIQVTALINVPVEATDEQIREWVLFSLYSGSIRLDNPLSNHDMDADGYVNIRTVK